jgi:hypothetical protein
LFDAVFYYGFSQKDILISNKVSVVSDKICSVLVLCEGNAARSILGVAMFNTFGKGKFIARSSGVSA